MSGLFGGLNAVADAWWLWVVHAGWQAAAVGLAILLVERLGRRWPSPIRYGLLVLAIVKFAVPATSGASAGLFGWIGPSVSVPSRATESEGAAGESAVAVGSHERADAALPVAGGPVAARDMRGQAPGPVKGSAADVTPLPPARGHATTPDRPVPGWKAWLMLFHAAGVAGLAAWIAGQWVRLLRCSRHSQHVTAGVLHEQFLAICREMGLRRSVRLLLTPEGDCPYSLGLLRPAVAIPCGLADRLSEADLRAALAHEAGHHRRGDLWVNAVQMAICTLWWFHPVVWLVNGAIRRVREECCDDLILGKKLIDADSYCGTLLQVAAAKTRRQPPRLAVSMAEGLHPLGRRFIRIMDTTLRRPAKTPWAALVTFAVLAVLLLPGLRSSAECSGPVNETVVSHARTEGETGTLADGRPLADTEADEMTIPSELEAAKLKARRGESRHESRDSVRIFRGRVVDESGRPVAGGHVWYPVKWTAPMGYLSVDAACDSQGRFALSVPAAWLDKPSPVLLAWEVWALAEGRSIGTASVYKQIFAPEKAGELKIVLGPPSNVSFVVLRPGGGPVAGAVLEPQNFRTQTGYSRVPEPMLPRLRATTDARGRAAMPTVPGEGLYNVVVQSGEFGKQIQIFRKPENTPAKRVVLIRPTGRVEGRVVADDPALARGLQLGLTTQPNSINPSSSAMPATEGFAMVASDDDGRFAVPALAEGALRIDTRVTKPDLPFRPRLPDQVQVQAGQTTEVEIRIVPAIRVEGMVRVRGTSKPVEGVEVSVRYGIGRQSDMATSDAEGKFTAYVLPGEVRLQMIYIPEGLLRVQTAQPPYAATCVVPEDAKRFTLPPLEVVETRKVNGRLVDPSGEPVANAMLGVEWKNAQDYVGNSDEQGRFVIRLPADAPLDAIQFNVFFRSTLPHKAEVLDRDPLVLRVHPPENAGD